MYILKSKLQPIENRKACVRNGYSLMVYSIFNKKKRNNNSYRLNYTDWCSFAISHSSAGKGSIENEPANHSTKWSVAHILANFTDWCVCACVFAIPIARFPIKPCRFQIIRNSLTLVFSKTEWQEYGTIEKRMKLIVLWKRENYDVEKQGKILTLT